VSLFQARGDNHRNVCIIPTSAHGTNPASAAMCGMSIVTIGTDAHGNVDIAELQQAAEKHKDNLAALMVIAHCRWCLVSCNRLFVEEGE